MDDTTRGQIDELLATGFGADRDRPLLVCDVDEVVLHLVAPFEAVLGERGWRLKTRSFKLTGNVFRVESGAEASQADIWAALEQLFAEQQARQHLVDGVRESLTRLADDLEIVFLTNMPHGHAETRAAHLRASGMPYPLVTNSGSKAPAVAALTQGRRGNVGFVDDTPVNLAQVGAAHPHVHLFHLMADDTFRAMVEPMEGVLVSTGDWGEAERHMRQALLPRPDGERDEDVERAERSREAGRDAEQHRAPLGEGASVATSPRPRT